MNSIKIKKALRSIDIFLSFLISLIMIQALAISGGFNFDSILPYSILLIFILFWQEKPQIGKRNIIISCLFTFFFMVLYVLGNNASLMTGVIVLIGSFLLGCFFSNKLTKIRFNKYAGILSILLIIIIVLNLIQEKFILVSGLQWYKIPALILSIGTLYIVLYNTLYEVFQSKEHKINGYSATGAILFAVFATVGHIYAFEDKLVQYKLTLSFVVSIMFAFICWVCIFYICFEKFYSIIKKISLIYNENTDKIPSIKVFWVVLFSFVFIAVCFIPYFLRYYPGVIEYDSWMQMVQVLGAPYSNHHPWLHTMIIKGIYEIGIFLFHSENRAIALYSCFSISLLAFSISCVIGYLYSKKVKMQFLFFFLVIYALSPINGIYSIIMWKDVPFAAVCLLFLVLLAYMKDRIEKGKINVSYWILFVILSFMVCFLRSNGLYAYVFLLPFIIYAFRSSKMQVITSICITLMLSIIYKGPVFHYFEVTEPDTIESLSVPAQQIAAVIAYEGNVTEEQKELLEDIISLDKVPKAYLGSVHCSDSIKDLVRLKGNQELINTNKMDYLRLWIQMGLNNKYIYLKAFVDETSGYWYHKITYPFIWATYVMENGSGINRECKLSPVYENKVTEYMENYEVHFWKYYSNGLFVYLLFICLIIAIRNRSKYLVLYLWNLGIWLTLIVATPVYADFRYAYAIFLAVPFLIFITIADTTTN